MAGELARQQQQFVEWLDRRGPVAFDITETHVSWVGIQGDRVFKCKKAVSFPFVDLSTLDRRRYNCVREVELNRRFAPDVYIGVVDVTDSRGRVVDYAVEMRRLPVRRTLAVVAEDSGDDARACVERVADALAEIHAQAPRSATIDAAGTGAAVLELWERGFHEVQPYLGTVLDAAVERDIETLVERYVRGRTALFEARIATGHVCDGHGDLLAGDVYCLSDGPRLLDCLEFDDRLRWSDALADVAFLVMDLEYLGHGDLARTLLDRYRSVTNDRWPPSLEHFYIAYRAHVRAKVLCLQRRDEAAEALLLLAQRHLVEGRVRMVIVGGPPGTGKSTIARAIRASFGWHLIASDVVRKELAGLAPERRTDFGIDHGLYSPAWTERTYAALLREAGRTLARGNSVVLDASWSQPGWREAARRCAAAQESDLTEIRCDAPVEIAAARTQERPRDPSDARPEVARALAARFAPWPESFVLDTSRSAQEASSAVLSFLQRR